MATIPSGFGQVNLRFRGAGYPTGAEVTFGIQVLTAGDPTDVGEAIRTLWGTELQERTPVQVTLNTILVKFGPNDTGPFVEIGVGQGGGGSAGNVNPNMAILITKVTALGGRANRGRWYYPVAEDQVANAGILNPAEVTEMNTQVAAFLAGLTAGDTPMVVLHNDPLTAPTTVTGMLVQGTTATQRRRLRR
jgi:hypothetical protein